MSPIKEPRSLESEQRVLGALLLDSTLFGDVSEKICPEDFTKTLHQEIFTKMRKLMINHKSFDAQMICDALKLNKACEKYLYELANDCASTANIKAHADIVREKSVQRQLIKITTEIAHEAKNPGNKAIEKILDDADSKVKDLYSPAFCTEQMRLASFFRELAEEIDSTNPHEFCESYLQFTIVEVNKALVDTLRHVEETHPDNYEGDEYEHH